MYHFPGLGTSLLKIPIITNNIRPTEYLCDLISVDDKYVCDFFILTLSNDYNMYLCFYLSLPEMGSNTLKLLWKQKFFKYR